MRLNIAGLTVEIPYDLLEDAKQYIEEYQIKPASDPKPTPGPSLKGRGGAGAVEIDSVSKTNKESCGAAAKSSPSGEDLGEAIITVVNDICEFGEQLPLFNRFLMHGVAITYNGGACAKKPTPSIRPTLGVYTADPLFYGLLKQFAEANRKNPTEAENVLWNILKGNGLGLKFRRQHIIEDFIVDFYCEQARLTIEIDGGYHEKPAQMKSDAERTARLKELGFCEIRFSNAEVLFDTDNVIRRIKDNAYPRPLPKGKGVGAGAAEIDSAAKNNWNLFVAAAKSFPSGEDLGEAFIITAPSGVGKSTHAFLWQRLLGKENVHIINGDKPIIQAVPNQDAHGKSDFLAWGTPWCGKEGLHENVSAPLKGIGLLHRLDQEHPTPSVTQATSEEFIDFMMDQVFLPRGPEMLRRVFDMLERLYLSVPIFHLYMDMSKEAVELSVNTLLAYPRPLPKGKGVGREPSK